jgi:hypothetical protein
MLVFGLGAAAALFLGAVLQIVMIRLISRAWLRWQERQRESAGKSDC